MHPASSARAARAFHHADKPCSRAKPRQPRNELLLPSAANRRTVVVSESARSAPSGDSPPATGREGESHGRCNQRWSRERHSSHRAGRTGRRGKDQPGRGHAVRRRRNRPPGSTASGSSIGDSSPEARQRGGSTELNLYNFDYLGDQFALIDSPGSVGFAADGARALALADLAIVVVDPDPARAPLAAPALRTLDELGIPHLIFVNRIDQAHGRIRDLLSALQPMSVSPLIARQIPIREGDKVTGFVDLALERAFHYRPGKDSEQIDIPADLQQREAEARTHMLEQLADHDDELLEQLLMDEAPSQRPHPAGPRPRNRRKPRRAGAVRIGAQRLGRAPAAQSAAPRGARPPRGRGTAAVSHRIPR